MSEERALLADTAARLFAELAQTPTISAAVAWSQADQLGLPRLMVDEASGGIGGGWADLFAIQWEAGRKAATLPIGEAILANWMCSRAGLEIYDGFGSVACDAQGELRNARFSGTLANVPWGRHADWVVCILASGSFVRLQQAHAAIKQGENLAGEARDSLVFDDAPCERVSFLGTVPHVHSAALLGALLRLGQISGALSAALDLTTDHVTQRVQFGKRLSAFQSVQQQLAVFAIEATAAGCAARAACEAADRAKAPEAAWYAISSAKLRANLAIGISTAIAHQLHGAIGFTREHSLHPLTRRLWAWRTEAGNDRFWSARLGTYVANRGADAAWADVIAASLEGSA
jgi:acyl-CoA dehydrogenase